MYSNLHETGLTKRRIIQIYTKRCKYVNRKMVD